tara:strand:- start:359 stop:691 length:333 start_codon:yes stop_codon:yes gene_type:complete
MLKENFIGSCKKKEKKGSQMNRTTSRIAYKEHKQSGKLDQQKQHIKNLLLTEYPLSRREISRATNIEISSVSGRINEMIKMGVVEETTRRKCMFSKKLITPVQLVGSNNG